MAARQLFYDGTVAYKTGDFPTAADKFKAGLRVWKTLMDDFPTYREDELSKKETGQIVKRYMRVLKQNLTPIPDDLPFKEYLPLVQNDTTVDPFDTLEMIGVPGESGAAPAMSAQCTRPPARAQNGGAREKKARPKKSGCGQNETLRTNPKRSEGMVYGFAEAKCS